MTAGESDPTVSPVAPGLIRRLLDLVPDVVFLYDAEGRYRYANRAALEYLERPLGEVVGRTVEGLFPAAAAASIRAHHEAALASGQTQRHTYPLEMPSGETCWWEVDWVPVTEGQVGFAGVAGIARDITPLSDMRRKLRKERATTREILDNLDEVIWFSSSDKEEIVYVNPAYEKVWGRDRERLYENPRAWLEAVHPEDRLRVEAALPDQAEGGYEEEYRIVCPDGEMRWIRDRAYPVRDDDEVVRVAGIAEDVTERRQLQEALEHRALHDQLTGLPNRTLFNDRLTHALQRAERGEELAAVLFLDLDGFKSVNDSRGHAAGDRVLQMVAGRLQRALRDGDTVARLGGDEFAVLLEGISSRAGIQQAVSRIRAVFEGPFEIEDTAFSLTVSLGVAHSGHDFDEPEDLVRLADVAMYRAKRRGGQGVHVLDSDHDEESREKRPTTERGA